MEPIGFTDAETAGMNGDVNLLVAIARPAHQL
jgi:hypothetical protein